MQTNFFDNMNNTRGRGVSGRGGRGTGYIPPKGRYTFPVNNDRFNVTTQSNQRSSVAPSNEIRSDSFSKPVVSNFFNYSPSKSNNNWGQRYFENPQKDQFANRSSKYDGNEVYDPYANDKEICNSPKLNDKYEAAKPPWEIDNSSRNAGGNYNRNFAEDDWNQKSKPYEFNKYNSREQPDPSWNSNESNYRRDKKNVPNYKSDSFIQKDNYGSSEKGKETGYYSDHSFKKDEVSNIGNVQDRMGLNKNYQNDHFNKDDWFARNDDTFHRSDSDRSQFNRNEAPAPHYRNDKPQQSKFNPERFEVHKPQFERNDSRFTKGDSQFEQQSQSRFTKSDPIARYEPPIDLYERRNTYDRFEADNSRSKANTFEERQYDTNRDTFSREDPWEDEENFSRNKHDSFRRSRGDLYERREYSQGKYKDDIKGGYQDRNQQDRGRFQSRNQEERFQSRSRERGEQQERYHGRNRQEERFTNEFHENRRSQERYHGRGNRFDVEEESWYDEDPPNKRARRWSPPVEHQPRFSPPRKRTSEPYHQPKQTKNIPKEKQFPLKRAFSYPNTKREFYLNMPTLPQPNKGISWLTKRKKPGLPYLNLTQWNARVEKAKANLKQCYNPRLIPPNPSVAFVIKDLFQQIKIISADSADPNLFDLLIVHGEYPKKCLNFSQKDQLVTQLSKALEDNPEKQPVPQIRCLIRRPSGLVLKNQTAGSKEWVEKFMEDFKFEVPLKILDPKEEEKYKRLVVQVPGDPNPDQLLQAIREENEIDTGVWGFASKSTNETCANVYYDVPIDIFDTLMGKDAPKTLKYKGEMVKLLSPVSLMSEKKSKK